MQAFAFTIYAYKWSGETIITSYGARVGVSPDEKLMRKAALDLCRETFPEDEGYHGHQISIMRADGVELVLDGVKYILHIKEGI